MIPSNIFSHTDITKVAVIGAGSMGAGIAAQCANAGMDVVLLDIPSEEGDRSQRAIDGIKTQVKRKGFMSPAFAERITPGNTEDSLDLLKDRQWVIEAVFEDPDVKHDLYAKIEPFLASDTILSSNTSTIPLAKLAEKLSEDRRKNFVITHFFNPPRVMKLVEVVTNDNVAQETTERITNAIEQGLGKYVLDCRDTPGFIANRVGNLWMAAGARIAFDNDIKPELADAVFSKPFGIPRTGIFGLFDYVGLQLIPFIWGSTTKAVSAEDAYNTFNIANEPLFTGLIERGLTGRTGESGIYRGRDEVVTEDFSYRKKDVGEDEALTKKTAKEVMETDSPAGRYAKDVFFETLKYCIETAEEISDTVEQVDAAMELGYGWKKGPFKLADDLGLDWIKALAEEKGFSHELLDAAIANGGFYPGEFEVLSSTGEKVNSGKRHGVVTLAELEAAGELTEVSNNGAARILRTKDDIAIFDFLTPMNSCNKPAIEMMAELVSTANDYKAIVVGNDEARAFSAGAHLPTIVEAGETRDLDKASEFIRRGNQVFRGLRASGVPVVGAVRGVALGGGMELMLACDAAAVHAETRVGFPERNVGLFPAWCGTVRSLQNLQTAGVSAADSVKQTFELMANATPISAVAAKERNFLGERHEIFLSDDHIFGYALEIARKLADEYSTHNPDIALESAGDLLSSYDEANPDALTDTDREILAALEEHLGGTRTVSVDELGESEVTHATPLVIRDNQLERARAMATTRKPLRN